MFLNMASIILLSVLSMSGEDILIPDDGSITTSYTISRENNISSDTLNITRKIYNNSDYNIDSMVILANVPHDINLSDFTLYGRNGVVNIHPLGPLEDHIITGATSYMWTITPNDNENSYLLAPGGETGISYAIYGNLENAIILPPHAAIFYSGSKEIYSVSDSILVELAAVDENTGENILLPDRLEISATPNPFNATATLKYASNNLKGSKVKVKIYDLLGRTVYDDNFTAEANSGSVSWTPSSQHATGVYFYRFTAGAKKAEGKLLFLK